MTGIELDPITKFNLAIGAVTLVAVACGFTYSLMLDISIKYHAWLGRRRLARIRNMSASERAKWEAIFDR